MHPLLQDPTHPFWEQLRREHPTVVEAYARALAEPAPVSIRRNPAKHPHEAGSIHEAMVSATVEGTAASSLADTGISSVDPTPLLAELFDGGVPWEPLGQYLRERPSFTTDPLFHAGAYYVQEASSMLIGHAARHLLERLGSDANHRKPETTTGAAPETKPRAALGSTPGSTSGTSQRTTPETTTGTKATSNTHLRVLDLCAAPGGKSTHLASVLEPHHLLVANEIVRSRAQVLSENIQKWGQANVVVTSNEPAHFRTLGAWFDLILVDAPCSGEGLFRRDPDAESHWSPEAIAHCALRQHQILDDIWPALKPGGFLIYSTCTFNRTENDISLKKLLASEEALPSEVAIAPEWSVLSDHLTVNDISLPIYRCFPGNVRGEGFTFSVVQKRSNVVADYGESRGKGRFKRVATHPNLDKLDHASAFSVWQSQKHTFAFPKAFDRDIAALDDGLYIHHAGVGLGDAQRPDHSLALSTVLKPGAFPELALTKDQALDYLRRESIAVPGDLHGLVRLTYAGLGLGFGKAVRGRLNNHYPQEWRIRMR
jgi:16S rRNA C967 or C1407 C5-methylase (RsmB/RsmF family)/NOL1/NOP2/fmu family ribosome biogenesis protein